MNNDLTPAPGVYAAIVFLRKRGHRVYNARRVNNAYPPRDHELDGFNISTERLLRVAGASGWERPGRGHEAAS